MHSSAEGPSRALGLLALAWIVGYWWWQPGAGGGIVNSSLEQRPARTQVQPPAAQTTPPILEPLPMLAPLPGASGPYGQEAAPEPSPQVAVEQAADAEPLPSDRPVNQQEDRPGDRFHVVRRGDTLSEIALREYGSIRFAELIFEANRDQLASMDDLQIGMELRLPPAPR